MGIMEGSARTIKGDFTSEGKYERTKSILSRISLVAVSRSVPKINSIIIKLEPEDEIDCIFFNPVTLETPLSKVLVTERSTSSGPALV